MNAFSQAEQGYANAIIYDLELYFVPHNIAVMPSRGTLSRFCYLGS